MKINRTQRIMLYIIVFCIAVIVIDLPYHSPGNEGVVINYLRLITELIVVVIVGGLAFLVAGKRKRKDLDDENH